MKPDNDPLNTTLLNWGLFAGIVTCSVIILATFEYKREKMEPGFTKDDAQRCCLDLILYAQDHHEHCPTNLNQILPYLGAHNSTSATTNGFEMVYQGSMLDFTNGIGSRTIVLRSKSWINQDGKWVKIFGFADGHCETRFQTNADFMAWESQHMAIASRNR